MQDMLECTENKSLVKDNHCFPNYSLQCILLLLTTVFRKFCKYKYWIETINGFKEVSFDMFDISLRVTWNAVLIVVLKLKKTRLQWNPWLRLHRLIEWSTSISSWCYSVIILYRWWVSTSYLKRLYSTGDFFPLEHR